MCESIFKPLSGSPMDELFTRYMYYLRAKQGIRSTTTEALRKFYEKNGYALLKNDSALQDLEALAKFWISIENQSDKFSEKILKKLFILEYAPNGMWTYLLSVYFMVNKDDNDNLEENKLYKFLNKITAFIWTYAIIRPGVNALRTPVYPEMIRIVNGQEISFADYLLDQNEVSSAIRNYVFTNGRPITKSILAWWMYQDDNQVLLSTSQKLEIEHIFARKRQEIEKTLTDKNNLEKLGNKALLEEGINIRASDYRFKDKIRYYQGFTSDKGVFKEGTKDIELVNISGSYNDYTEQNIIDRTNLIFEKFIQYVKENDLFK